jgi:Ribbon-helix-helix protein, copG family
VSKRTTLTIEDDIADSLQNEVRRTGRPLKEVVNDALRRGLARDPDEGREPFRVHARDLRLRPGVELDDIEGLLERLEGPDRR